MKKMVFAILLVLALCIGAAAAEEAESFLGKPFPDFTVTDSEGKTFTLSEAVKNHEAVVINCWATWCEPCKNEFPFLNRMYEEYGGRVAFIALSKEPNDTLEKIEAYRKDKGITFPMGRDEDGKILSYISSTGSVPQTVIVDRFGIAVFHHGGTFRGVEEIRASLGAFVGEDYTETKVLEEIPQDTSTQAFPVSAKEAIYPEDRSYKKVLFSCDMFPEPWAGYIIPDDSFRMRVEVAATDIVPNLQYVDEVAQGYFSVESLLDPKQGIYVYNQKMPTDDMPAKWVMIYLYDKAPGADLSKNAHIFLMRSEENIQEIVDYLKRGATNVSWKYADEEETAGDKPGAYVVRVVDQDNNPVPEVTVNFCTDSACTPKDTNDEGVITYEGERYAYHLQIVDVPDGYSYDEGFTMYTTEDYGEWVLRVKKD